VVALAGDGTAEAKLRIRLAVLERRTAVLHAVVFQNSAQRNSGDIWYVLMHLNAAI
jgi:hypothetical protein